MDEQLTAKLKEWAGTYNVKSFISDDPVQFPHRFTEKRDIEISAFITSWISYGRRELILRKADWLHSRMGGSPYEWVLSGRYRELVSDVPAGKRDTFYRFYTHSDLCALCDRLKEIYERYDSLEDASAASPYPNPVLKLQDLYSGINGIPPGYVPSLDDPDRWNRRFRDLEDRFSSPPIDYSAGHACSPDFIGTRLDAATDRHPENGTRDNRGPVAYLPG